MIERSSGIILPVSSLPSPYGIGTLGKAAYDFIDFLVEAEQSWWQMLPLGPTSYGDSPYQSFSTHAGNPYFVDLDMLVEEGLLEQSEIDACEWGDTEDKVEYSTIYENRFKVLRIAAERGWKKDHEELEKFIEENNSWIHSYALFMALKKHFGNKAWTEWEDEDIRTHKRFAVDRYYVMLEEDIKMYIYIQYQFFKQWNMLREYAQKNNIGIIGDIPIYVAMDSADVWAEPYWFQLDADNVAHLVAGVPPDAYAEDGQLWGNPLYNWERMREDGYGWWIRRIGGAAKLFDAIRIDHFRGLESYFAVDANAETARDGFWIKGPGMDLMGRLQGWFKNVQFIAEDLGFLTPEVKQLLADSGLPGMKVLEFAFDVREPSNYLPHTHIRNSVCYLGTHDNETVLQWKDAADPECIEMATEYLGLNDEEGFVWGMMRGGMSSVSNLFIAQMQDLLELGAEARMNTPGVVGGNWQWRLVPGQITEELTKRIAGMTRLYGRSER